MYRSSTMEYNTDLPSITTDFPGLFRPARRQNESDPLRQLCKLPGDGSLSGKKAARQRCCETARGVKPESRQSILSAAMNDIRRPTQDWIAHGRHAGFRHWRSVNKAGEHSLRPCYLYLLLADAGPTQNAPSPAIGDIARRLHSCPNTQRPRSSRRAGSQQQLRRSSY